MNRLVAAALAVLAALAVAGVDPPPAAGQPKKKAAAPAPADDDVSKVLPVFDPGTHTRPILAMSFTADGSRLVTLGRDHTAQVWNAATGERVDILRLPGYGNERGLNPGQWGVGAVSADGRRAALGGEEKRLYGDDAADPTRLVLLDIPTRTVRRVAIPGANFKVAGLAFAPDGETLAVTFNRAGAKTADLVLVGGLTQRLAAPADVVTKDCPQVPTPHPGAADLLRFAPDGRKLLVGGAEPGVSVWDVTPGHAPKATLAKAVATIGETTGAAWAPDGTKFLRYDGIRGKFDERHLEYLAADGTRLRKWGMPELSPAVVGWGRVYGVTFVDPDTVHLVANGQLGTADGPGTRAALFDLKTGKATLLATEGDLTVSTPTGDVAPGGKLGAATVARNTVVAIAPLTPNAPQVRCGVRAPVPTSVGWAKNPAAPGFAWGEAYRSNKVAPSTAGLAAGFDFTAVAPTPAVAPADYLGARRTVGDWTLDAVRVKDKNGKATSAAYGQITNAATGASARLPLIFASARTLVDVPGGPPLVAFANHHERFGDQLWLHKADGTRFSRLLPDAVNAFDLAASPDGRYLVGSTGTPRVVVYRTDGTPHPMLSFARLNGEWVCWTPEGYYAASPGGERMFGFAVNNGPNQLVTFHPAERFAKHFRRPDVLTRAIETGSVKAALDALGVAARSVAAVLPPAARVEVLAQTGGRVRVRATATSPDPGKPVLAMRLLVDGVSLGGGNGVWTPGPGPASAEFEFDIPPRLHDLTVLARNIDGSTVSDPVTVRGPRPTGPRPTLYRVCVGVSEYVNSGLNLSNAARDARDVFDALGKHCAGPGNEYAEAKGALLVDADATRGRVQAAIETGAAAARPGDLVVVFFAGHGKKHGDEYYLYTREADPTAMAGKSLAGADLLAALKDTDGTVLLALDACHSADAVSKFRPAVTDLTRDLGTPTVRVTVMSAAMADETAGSGKRGGPNGAFTAALLKGLRTGTPFDRVEGAMTVQHLYMTVFDEVRAATNGNQNPFLYRPETVPAFFVRTAPSDAAGGSR